MIRAGDSTPGISSSGRLDRLSAIAVLAALVLFTGSPSVSRAQVPGANPFVRVAVGSYPIIVSAPHGGYLAPDSLADRSCANCVTVRDLRTQEWAEMLASAIEARTGHRPWVVINLLARSKLDANREVIEAADGDPHAEAAWVAYHEAIERASEQVELQFGHGLLLDLHGHGHEVQRFELGYLISGLRLREPDAVLDGRAAQSSIRSLVGRAGEQLSALIRGDHSFGELLVNAGVAATPSVLDPAPSAREPFFSGGYITARHGSRDGGSVDAIQLEAHYENARDSEAHVAALAEQVGLAAVNFIERWYPGIRDAAVESTERTGGDACLTQRGDGLHLSLACPSGVVVLYDVAGRRIMDARIDPGQWVRMPPSAPGIYFARMTGARRATLIPR